MGVAPMRGKAGYGSDDHVCHSVPLLTGCGRIVLLPLQFPLYINWLQ
jgi:hypothetical protein